jgi:carbonic anhydrase/acetyltransferase-like protein (isoleucine patch superfamily)
MVGMGAIVLSKAVIGDRCVIGAGAVVKEGDVIPEGGLVVGVPGKVIKQLSQNRRRAWRRIARNTSSSAAGT